MSSRGSVTTEMFATEGSFTANFVGWPGFAQNVGDKICSPTYEFAGALWSVGVFPVGESVNSEGYLSCYIDCVPDSTTRDVKATASISILNNKQQKTNKTTKTRRIDCAFSSFHTAAWAWGKFISLDDLNSPTKEIFTNNTITFLVELKVYGPLKEYKHVVNDLGNKTVLKELNNLLYDTTLADVFILVVQQQQCTTVTSASHSDSSLTADNRSGKRKHDVMESIEDSVLAEERIPAHKLILSMRSPVFRTMFASGMAESLTNEVRIQDFDAAVVKEFLRFLYTDQCEVDKHAEQLLAMACKYQVPGLKYFCENHLCAMIDSTSVISLLSLAHMYDATQLKACVLHYITRHTKEVVVVDGFMESIGPDLMKEVVFALAGLPKDD